MLRTEMPKVLKVAILVLTILMMPLAKDAWARSNRGESERSKDSSSKQQSERSSVQTRDASFSPEARRTIRETPRGDAPTQRVSREPQTQKPSTVVNRPDFARPQPQLSNLSPAPRPAPSPRSISAAKPENRIVVQDRPARVERSLEQPTTGKERTGTNRGGLKDDGKESVRQKPADVVNPLAVTTRVRKDDSRTDTPVINQRDNKEPSGNIDQTVRNSRDNDSGKQENTRITDRRSEPRTQEQRRKFIDDRIANRHIAIGKNLPDRKDFVRSHRDTVLIGRGDHDYNRFRPASTSKVIYEDRDRTFNRSYNHDFVSRDRHNRLNYSIISPRYSFPLCYNWGRHHSVRYVYPYYHRRYVFVSLGGFWPDYSCVRYYWYPSHSYLWYGYYPVAQEVGGDTYNYYTYNYYDQLAASANDNSAGIATVDETTFADVREKLARQQALEPAAQTDADTLFDEGVKAFEQGSYAEAEEKFARAMAIAPDDMILPFAYAQALLAQGKYTRAAEILRVVVQKSTPDKQGIFFPRGLYLDENTLDEQIDRLSEAVANNPADTDMQLLLGYQSLGIGETEKAIESLNSANTDGRNFATVNVLLDLAEKIKSGETK